MKPKKELLFLALGGSGEIGMNVNLYGCNGKWIMVDLGISFSDPYYPGTDLVLPDLEFIERNADDLLGIVLTHGHEDHIGAIPWLAEELGVPLYATKFTAGLIGYKLREHGLEKDIELNVIEDDGQFQLGDFGIRYVPLAHSIAEGNALLIETPYGNIFHTGDWKIDEEPQIGTPSTAEELTAIGDEGVLALVCDSTNVFNESASGSEAMVRESLMEACRAIDTRIMVTTFASNLARLQTLGEVAKATGRELCVAGRSLDRMIENAKATGYLKNFPEVVRFDEAMQLPRSKVLIVATGGQGDPRAALARVAEGNHKLSLETGDVVLFSSKQIPGNEIAIGIIQNKLAEMDVTMVTERQADIHVSGHPGRPELKSMYDWIRPDILMPVHGEMRHMKEQARLGLAHGIPRAVVQKNGDVVRLAPGEPKIIGRERAGRLIVDGDIIIAADGATMNERRRISNNGQISVAVAIDAGGNIAGDPVMQTQGVPIEDERDEFFDDAIDAARKATKKFDGDIEKLRENVRLAVRRTAREWTGKKPIVDVLVVEA
ncbi:ribonuclease J [Novosphingopyxis iocasae]|uniref:ribonuclease J n=1 Tax=Novosphingopyxis iocasae TaxID=2762729 RepID=UPI001650F52A|nr:ribonuclease J [Novosphingopyxis iocasae]